MSVTVFFFISGTRMPVLTASEVQPDSSVEPLPLAAVASLDELQTTFPRVPLKLQPPVRGVTDLTVPTIKHWLSDRSPEVFLTFDDGPSPQATGMILDLLQVHEVKATFFVLGHNAILYPELIKRIVAEGHELALHSYSHPNLLTLTREQKEREIAESLSILHWYFPNVRIRWFRPPYGYYDQEVIDIAHEYGMCLALFNDISTDSRSSSAKIAQTVVNGNGKIIVFHDGQLPRTSDLTEPERRLVEGLTASVGHLKARGGHIKTLSSHFGRFCP